MTKNLGFETPIRKTEVERSRSRTAIESKDNAGSSPLHHVSPLASINRNGWREDRRTLRGLCFLLHFDLGG